MKKLPITGFDIGAIIAAVVIALLGAGGWWYLTGALQEAQGEDASAKSDYDKYSTKYDIVVSPTNGKVLQANNDLLKAQIDPLIKSTLLPKENKLRSIDKKDPVAWKHDLDAEVHALNAAAKAHSVTVPPNFYFGFSRYVNQSPGDEQTLVLGKQLLGVQELSTILINAPVKDILAIRRTYEEDPHITGSGGGGGSSDGDHLGGNALVAPASAYTVYPFEVEFDTTPENLRPIVDNLIQSPYLFVVRTLIIENSNPDSPKTSSLDAMAGTPASPSVVDSAPGTVASTQSTLGPQKFFGYSTLKVKARIDMVEWTPKDK